MARQGVSFSDVSAAANQIKGQGRNPTIEQIRIFLGTGSSTTIANHLKAWKASQSSNSLMASKEQIPEALVATMKGLWERVISIADEKLLEEGVKFKAQLTQKQEELDKYRQNNQRWQQLYHAWIKEKEATQQERLALENLIENMKEEHRVLQTTYKLSTQQLVEKQDRLQELHHHLQQTQKNYEEFREASCQQRKDEIAEFNAQKKLLTKENVELQSDLKALQDDFHLLRGQYQKVCHDNESIAASHKNKKAELTDCQIELDKCRTSMHEYSYSSQHWQSQYQEIKNQLEDTTARLIEKQSQIKFNENQLQSKQNEVDRLHEQNKQLEKDNWSLIQEKSLLVSQ